MTLDIAFVLSYCSKLEVVPYRKRREEEEEKSNSSSLATSNGGVIKMKEKKNI